MVEFLMSLALAFCITFYAIPAIIHVAIEKKLYDFPNDRKIHQQPVPSLGGLGIFAGVIVAFLLIVRFEGLGHRFQYMVAAMLVIFFVGMKDDLLSITPFKKFLGQVLAATILVFKGGMVIGSMDGVLGIYDLPQWAAYSLTIVTIVVIINAYNLIDGVDGLAAGLTLISGGFFATYFAVNGYVEFACLSGAMLGAVGAFLIFNTQPARIFMGDSGSMVLGLLHAFLAVQFINTAAQAPILGFDAAPALAFAVMFIPLFDTLRVFSYRILHGTSPFTPDRNHIHHILLRFRLSHSQVVWRLIAAAIAVPVATWLLSPLGTNWLILGLIAIGFAAVGALVWTYRSRVDKDVANTTDMNPVAPGVPASVRSIAPPARKTAN